MLYYYYNSTCRSYQHCCIRPATDVKKPTSFFSLRCCSIRCHTYIHATFVITAASQVTVAEPVALLALSVHPFPNRTFGSNGKHFTGRMSFISPEHQ